MQTNDKQTDYNLKKNNNIIQEKRPHEFISKKKKKTTDKNINTKQSTKIKRLNKHRVKIINAWKMHL